jgi:hypothetical protein
MRRKKTDQSRYASMNFHVVSQLQPKKNNVIIKKPSKKMIILPTVLLKIAFIRV